MSTKKKEATVNQDRPIMILEKRGSKKATSAEIQAKMEAGKVEVMKVVEGVPGAEKLAELILQMKAEIASLRSGTSMEYPDGVCPKKKAIAAYLREHPGVTSKSMIARELQMDRTTVQRYYDEVQAELRGDESPAMQM